MPRFEPFPGIRYRATELSSVIAPPYDVISDDQRIALEAADPRNAVRLELPRDDSGADRYRAAAARLADWLADGTLAVEAQPAFYGYRMSFIDEAGQPRSTSGVIGALRLEPPGQGDILPHERTTPKAKSDRLELLRATRANLSPVWGLSLSGGLSALCQQAREPDATAEADGVRHEVWVLRTPALIRAIADEVASAPVVIADGHHRYEVALGYQAECSGGGPWDSVMTYVVELSEDQLVVAAIHRLISGLPEGFDVLEALDKWFEPVGSITLDRSVTRQMVEHGALALVSPRTPAATLLRPRPTTIEGAEADLDSSRLDLALSAFPPHDLAYQHGVDNVAAALGSGAAQAGILLRPVTVQQIARVARARDRMPPKTTFFTPKPATGLVFRSVEPQPDTP